MISNSTKYAFKAIVALKSERPETFIQVKQLATKARIPAPYLSKVIKILAKKDILQTRKGLHGGVRLYLDKQSLTLYDICQAMNEPILERSCFMSKYPCDQRSPCPLHNHWSGLKEKIISFLKKSVI